MKRSGLMADRNNVGANQLRILLVAFTLSGAAGLMYELLWTQYLRLYLGHAAYAQSFVIVLFMGGMSLGAFLCGRFSTRLRRPLLLYAWVEGAVGLYGVVFHHLFAAAEQLSHEHLFRGAAPLVLLAGKWLIAALLILGPSMLIGMTFPLMSAGVLRLVPGKPGRLLAILYAVNSFGAVAGLLLCGFLLIGTLGLPGSMAVSGCLSMVAAAAALTVRRAVPEQEPLPRGAAGAAGRNDSPGRLLLLVAFATGMASFMYEIGWIRMLCLVLGSSVHSFEIILSAFILGLALGSIGIYRVADRLQRPYLTLALIQVLMGCLAVATLPLYNGTFNIISWLLKVIPKTETGYLLFNLSAQGISMAIMLPATICAGMTLPLITRLLVVGGRGERSIGAVYGVNTLGGILGTICAVHIGFALLGVKGIIVAGAALDVILGLVLLWGAGDAAPSFLRLFATVLPIGVLATGAAIGLDPVKTTSGVFRTGERYDPSVYRVLFNRDGKTASVSVTQINDNVRSFRTNGKVDASVAVGESATDAASDDSTMVLLAAIPLAIHPEARNAANIGLGCGLTTEILLSVPRVRRVDTVEIEREMVAAARTANPRLKQTFADSRSVIHLEDARTFFGSSREKYDIIVSEPSNPWVSGVAGLFTSEFYGSIKKSLAPNGLFVQWVQLYEIDMELVAGIFKALAANFRDYQVYAANDNDIIVVAADRMLPDAAKGPLFSEPPLSRELERIGIRGPQDLAVRRLATREMLDGFFASFPIRANSDYHPVLEQRAPLKMFLKSDAMQLTGFSALPVPAVELLTGVPVAERKTEVTPSGIFLRSGKTAVAMALRDRFLGRTGSGAPLELPAEVSAAADRVVRIFRGAERATGGEGVEEFCRPFWEMIAFLTPEELGSIWRALEAGNGTRHLSQEQREWYSLFKAVGRRNVAAMVHEAPLLLRDPAGLSETGRKFLIASGMLGFLKTGDPQGAAALWKRYSHLVNGGKQPGFLFQLLLAGTGGVDVNNAGGAGR